MQLLWFIPTHGDGRYLATATGGRAVSFSYLRQIAQAVDDLGYTGALLPTGRSCEDAWIVASTLVSLTRQMRFLVAIRPGLVSPGVAARMAATFDRLSGGRLLINVVTGGDPVELAGDGLHLSHDQRYELTDEFLTVWRAIVSGEQVNLQGDYLNIQDGIAAVSTRPEAISALVVWRFLCDRPKNRCQACRCLSNLGRTTGASS